MFLAKQRAMYIHTGMVIVLGNVTAGKAYHVHARNTRSPVVLGKIGSGTRW